ncbi:unnamed protein product, partial [Adineta ricciae]
MTCPYAHSSLDDSKVNHQLETLDYSTYLRTDLLLSALKCHSHTDPLDNNSPPIHDEHFFILVHQVFELWFKQILFELDSIRDMFNQCDHVVSSMFNINLRLKRIVNVFQVLNQQFQLLETMTPIEFL